MGSPKDRRMAVHFAKRQCTAIIDKDVYLTKMDTIIKNYFSGRKLVIGTMHGKEKIIGPLLKDALGVEILVPVNFNTDIYGTFSGEIERNADPVSAGRMKCLAACTLADCDLAIASEGSFGPHPTLPFAQADDEILVFLDLKNKLEIKTRKISASSNFGGGLFTDWKTAKKFAEASLFPSHSLIIRKDRNNNEDIVKGISSWYDLEKIFDRFLQQYGMAFLETDMRAMCNPTRQKVIHDATHKLIKTITRTCPDCTTPGLDIGTVRAGLPCGLCGAPTKSTYSFIYKCLHCDYHSEVPYPDGKEREDPMYCDYCNP
jgi:hypothetical protein